jgi:adenylosuccinate synthase
MKAPKSTAVVGIQWGDEGKGKIVDILAEQSDYVVRYQGGGNAGHTVVVDGKKHVLHLVPSGILHRKPVCVIGNGVVVEPAQFLQEVRELREKGVKVDRKNLLVSDRAHMVMPYHKLGDALAESASAGKIGTTKRGIGPCYADKAARKGFRLCDLFNEGLFKERLVRTIVERNKTVTALYGAAPVDADRIFAEYRGYAKEMEPFTADTTTVLNEAIDAGKRVMFEGAQGSLLDIDFGTYPYVTSSNSDALGICAGSGVPPRKIGAVLGVAKAYCTRVGEGPFPSELTDALGERLRETGSEYGATTGRPRRCGWFDVVSTRHAVMINGVDSLAITKLDVLSGLEEIRMVVAYRIDGKREDRVPADTSKLDRVETVTEGFAGWKEDLTGVKSFEKLPKAARAYLKALEQAVGVPISMVSVGSERSQTIER